MKNVILFTALTFLFIASFIELFAINAQAQKINELEKGVLYFMTEAEKLREEQDKQARLIATDLYIYANGLDITK